MLLFYFLFKKKNYGIRSTRDTLHCIGNIVLTVLFFPFSAEITSIVHAIMYAEDMSVFVFLLPMSKGALSPFFFSGIKHGFQLWNHEGVGEA